MLLQLIELFSGVVCVWIPAAQHGLINNQTIKTATLGERGAEDTMAPTDRSEDGSCAAPTSESPDAR